MAGFFNFSNTLSLIGKGLNLYSGIKAGQQKKSDYRRQQQAARAEGQYIERVANINAGQFLKEGAYQAQRQQYGIEQLEEQGKAGYEFYNYQADRQKRDEDRMLSQMRASYGASGVRVDSGSPALVQSYDKYVSDYNYKWNKHFADTYKRQNQRAIQVAAFEKSQALRVAMDQAKNTKESARLKRRSLERGAGFLDTQISNVNTQTGVGVANSLLDLGKMYATYNKNKGV